MNLNDTTCSIFYLPLSCTLVNSSFVFIFQILFRNGFPDSLLLNDTFLPCGHTVPWVWACAYHSFAHHCLVVAHNNSTAVLLTVSLLVWLMWWTVNNLRAGILSISVSLLLLFSVPSTEPHT